MSAPPQRNGDNEIPGEAKKVAPKFFRSFLTIGLEFQGKILYTYVSHHISILTTFNYPTLSQSYRHCSVAT